MPNGLFWTMAIPESDFEVWDNGKQARLHTRHLPMPDTFFYANNVSVAGEISVDLAWNSISRRVTRGKGNDVPPDDFAAFLGKFRDAECSGRASGAETGFYFKTEQLDASSFFAEIGYEENGVFL